MLSSLNQEDIVEVTKRCDAERTSENDTIGYDRVLVIVADYRKELADKASAASAKTSTKSTAE